MALIDCYIRQLLFEYYVDWFAGWVASTVTLSTDAKWFSFALKYRISATSAMRSSVFIRLWDS